MLPPVRRGFCPSTVPLAALAKGAAELCKRWGELEPWPGPGASRQGEATVELNRVGLPADGRNPESVLLCWQGWASEIANVVGGSHAQRRRLLAVIAGRVPAPAGQWRIAGVDLHALQIDEQRMLRHRLIGSVLSGGGLFAQFTLRENVALPLLVDAVPDTLALEQAQAELERLGLADLGDTQAGLVGAAQSRLARIAIAMVHKPRLCVIDAPEESLSDAQIALLSERLSKAAQDGFCLVLSTQHPRLAGLADTTLALSGPPSAQRHA